MYAAAAMALSSVSVVTNSLLLKRKTLKFNRKIDNKLSQKEMETYSFKTNINCNGCIAAVTSKLSEVKGIKHWQVDTENPDKILTVELENSKPEAIVDAVKSAGYTIEEL